MTYQELISEIKQLSSNEQLALLQFLTQLLQEAPRHSLRPTGSSLTRVRGMLKPEGPLPGDEELAEDYTRHLIEKYL